MIIFFIRQLFILTKKIPEKCSYKFAIFKGEFSLITDKSSLDFVLHIPIPISTLLVNIFFPTTKKRAHARLYFIESSCILFNNLFKNAALNFFYANTILFLLGALSHKTSAMLFEIRFSSVRLSSQKNSPAAFISMK